MEWSYGGNNWRKESSQGYKKGVWPEDMAHLLIKIFYDYDGYARL